MSSHGNNEIWMNVKCIRLGKMFITIQCVNTEKRLESLVKRHRIIIKVHKIICSTHNNILNPAIFFGSHQTFCRPTRPTRSMPPTPFSRLVKLMWIAKAITAEIHHRYSPWKYSSKGFHEKGVIKDLVKFTGKHLWRDPFFN